MGRYAEFDYNMDGVAEIPHRQGLYMVQDFFGETVYVGRSNDVHNRILAHLRNPAKQRFFGRVKVRWIQNWKELRRVEREKIQELDPVDNQIMYEGTELEYRKPLWERVRDYLWKD